MPGFYTGQLNIIWPGFHLLAHWRFPPLCIQQPAKKCV